MPAKFTKNPSTRSNAAVKATNYPELFLFGVHSQIGPFFHRDISFRPNAEFAFGEVTDVIAINLEAVYRLPISSRQGRWSAYFGAGPALNFINQDFERSKGGSSGVSFSDFTYDTGFNVLTGLQFRKGTFFELKTSLWSKAAPTLRLIFATHSDSRNESGSEVRVGILGEQFSGLRKKIKTASMWGPRTRSGVPERGEFLRG